MTARIAAFALMLTLGFASLAPAVTVHAASASELTASINALNKQLTEAGDQMNKLNSQINQINQQISDNTQKLEQTKADLATAKKNMGQRARVMYMFGNDGIMSALFTSSSLTETLSRIESVRTINSADQKTVEDVENLQTQVEQTQQNLQNQQKELKQQKERRFRRSRRRTTKSSKKNRSSCRQYAAQTSSSTAASTTSGSTADPGDQLDFICAVVAAECNASYDGALAVISCVMNRVDSGKWGGHDAVSVLKAPGQFAAYLDGPYKRYLGGKYPDYVKQAVIDCMQNGKRNHPYQSFRSGSSYGVWNCGGNSYR
ncbi:MAG: PcsB-like coiled-coil domain-containing protein [Pseudoramibacter sp.]